MTAADLSILFGSLSRCIRTVFAPWLSMYRPIESLLSAPSDVEKDLLTATWRDRKLAELTFVGVTVRANSTIVLLWFVMLSSSQCGLVASVISAAFTWHPLQQIPWGTAGLWYGALLMALTSICLATQQAVFLNRLSGYSDSLSRIRGILGSQPQFLGRPKADPMPNWDQLYVWQTPIMLLNFSVILFIVGIVIMLVDGLKEIMSSEHRVKVCSALYTPTVPCASISQRLGLR